MIRLALDMMGSDLGPKELAKGVALFQEKYGAECQLILVGKKEELPESGFEIEDAGKSFRWKPGPWKLCARRIPRCIGRSAWSKKERHKALFPAARPALS